VDGFMGCLESFVNYALLWIGLTVNWDSHLWKIFKLNLDNIYEMVYEIYENIHLWPHRN
jgi:hypothetical protein